MLFLKGVGCSGEANKDVKKSKNESSEDNHKKDSKLPDFMLETSNVSKVSENQVKNK